MPSILDRVRALGARVLTPSTAIIVSVVSLACSLTTLYFSQLRTTYSLSAIITDFSLDSADIQRSGDLLTFTLRANIGLTLTNSGNTPSSLLRVFLVSPKSFGEFDCKRAETITWNTQNPGYPAWFGPDFGSVAFSLKPQIISPFSVIYVEGNIDYVGKRADPMRGIRSSQDINKEKAPCIGFVVLNADGHAHITAVPAPLTYTVSSGGLAYRYRQQAWGQPIDLEQGRHPKEPVSR
jgi:hypothetical protein